MGQIASIEARGDRDRDSFSEEYDFLHDQIRKHSLTLRQLTLLTYDDLHNKIAELNALSSKFIDCNGKQLLFEVKPGTDSHVLWKGTVRVKCIKIDPVTQKVEKSRELYLKQFLQVYNTMQLHVSAGPGNKQKSLKDEPECSKDAHEVDAGCEPVSETQRLDFPMDASIILGGDSSEKLAGTGFEECCICMDSKPQVSLPCAHCYCLACIEQWNVDHKTCPICRDKLETTDDTWVLEDLPNAQEVSNEIQKSLFDLTR
jgi:hypothetical protein